MLAVLKKFLPGINSRYIIHQHLQQDLILIPDRPFFNTIQRNIPSTTISRLYHFAKLGTGVMTGTFMTAASQGFKGGLKTHLLNQKNVSLIAENLLKMRGAALKLGQFLSFQEDLPPQITEAMQKTRREAYIMPRTQLERVLIQELGNDWQTKYDHFDFQPFAAASIGQVHKAVYKGKQVAVKVQYPGVQKSIQTDLTNLKWLFQWTRIFPKGAAFDSLVDHSRQDLKNECNYLIQAEHQKKFKELLKGVSGYYVPEVIQELTTRHVLTTQYLHSMIFEDYSKLNNQSTKDWIAMKILQLTVREIFEFKYMQTDPNPANFQYNPKTKTLELLDFGATCKYSDDFIEMYRQVVKAGAYGDIQASIHWSRQLGYFKGDQGQKFFQSHARALVAIGEPLSEKFPVYDFSTQDITARVTQEMKYMIDLRQRPPPPQTYTLHRKLSGAYLLCMKLKARIPARQLFLKYIDK